MKVLRLGELGLARRLVGNAGLNASLDRRIRQHFLLGLLAEDVEGEAEHARPEKRQLDFVREYHSGDPFLRPSCWRR